MNKPPGAKMAIERHGLFAASIAVLLVLCACNGSAAPDSVAAADTPAPKVDDFNKSYNLTLHGFNYTDLYIYSYEVDGQGGGNMEVSVGSAGGSGSTCCITVRAHVKFPFTVHVKWNRGNDDRWCESDAQVLGPMPKNPGHFATHFFPDGHIEGEITEAYPKARLILERVHPDRRHAVGENHVADEQAARCKDGY